MDLVRKQTYITPEQDRAMKRLARRHGVTEAEVVRRALDRWLSAEEAAGRDDPFAMQSLHLTIISPSPASPYCPAHYRRSEDDSHCHAILPTPRQEAR